MLEDEESTARYDPSSGYLTVTLTKAVSGEKFEDLDLLAKLLAPRQSEQAPQGPLIEVLESQEAPGGAEDDEDELVARTRGLSLDRQEILEGTLRLEYKPLCIVHQARSQLPKTIGKSSKTSPRQPQHSRRAQKCPTDSSPSTQGTSAMSNTPKTKSTSLDQMRRPAIWQSGGGDA